jgi:hypothetical protein
VFVGVSVAVAVAVGDTVPVDVAVVVGSVGVAVTVFVGEVVAVLVGVSSSPLPGTWQFGDVVWAASTWRLLPDPITIRSMPRMSIRCPAVDFMCVFRSRGDLNPDRRYGHRFVH